MVLFGEVAKNRRSHKGLPHIAIKPNNRSFISLKINNLKANHRS